MKPPKYNYQVYKDERDCLTKKIITKAMYIILNKKKQPLIQEGGSIIFFHKCRNAIEFIIKKGEPEWRVKKVQLDVTTL